MTNPTISRRHIAWGFVDQSFSSATNFGLAILAGRALGAQGLGSIVIGLTVYLIALGFQRSLISDPLVAVSAALSERARRLQARHALTLVLVGAASVTLAMIAVGTVLAGSAAQGLLYFAPWLLAALLQDACRVVLLSRDGRGRAAALNDGIWLVTMLLLLPIPLTHPTGWAVVTTWGAGAAVAALVGLAQVQIIPARLSPSLRWWRREASHLARWLAASTVSYTLGAHLTTFLLGAIVGVAALGGLRATSTAFGPLSLVIPALALPGLPAITRAYRGSRHAALTSALHLTLIALVVTSAYSALFLLYPGLLPMIFGSSFAGFEDLVLPIALAQIVGASTIGFGLLLQAERRGRALFLCRTTTSVATLSFTAASALAWGVTGAAWAGVASAAVSASGLAAATFLRPGRRDANSPKVKDEPH